MRRSSVVVLLCAGVLLAGCAFEKKPSVDSYRVDAAGTTLTLVAVARPGSTARAEKVSEDDASVVVKVRVKEPRGDNLDLAENYPVTVKLDKPLGARAVRTDTGDAVPAAIS